MRPKAPRFPDDPRIREVTVVEDQLEYKTIVVAYVECDDGATEVYCRWTLTPEERARVAAGEDVYVSFPDRVAPHFVQLRPDWTEEP